MQRPLELQTTLHVMRSESLDIGNQYYLLQSRVKAIEGHIEKKVLRLETEHEKCVLGKPLRKKQKRARSSNPTTIPEPGRGETRAESTDILANQRLFGKVLI